jgi:hypothetical protein
MRPIFGEYDEETYIDLLEYYFGSGTPLDGPHPLLNGAPIESDPFSSFNQFSGTKFSHYQLLWIEHNQKL